MDRPERPGAPQYDFILKETNIIGRQRFRINVREEKDAELVFQRISDLMKARLPLLLDELFNDVLPTNKTIRIDQLRIDVGTLSESNLEEELTEGILSALRKQLTGITGTTTPSSTELEDQGRAPTYTKPEEMEVERLQFFLLNGYYPWWSARQEASSPDDLILSVLNKSLSRFREMISQIINKPRVRERLRQQFKAATLVAINARLSSSAWPQRYADLRLLATLYNLAPFSHQRPTANLERTLLVCSLNTLLNAPADSISADQWVLTLLDDLAEFTKIPLTDLSIHFSRTLQTSLRESASRFPADQVLRIRKQLPGREATSTNDKLDEPSLLFTQIFNFIRSGAPPQVGLLHDKPALEKELLRLLHAGDQRFARAFWSLLQEPGLPDRIHRSLTKATLEELHRILWGPEWETVKNYLSDFDQLLQAGNTLNLRSDRLRSHLLSDWMKARLTVFHPSHSKTTPRSLSGFWPSALRASFLRLAPDPELALAKLSGPTKVSGKKPVPASSLSWKSDLPELLTSRPSDSQTEKEESGPKPKPTGKQSVAIFRHFLEQGILPEGHAKNGLNPILKDIHRQALSGSEVLFKMLARVLRNERSFSRFRAELPLLLMYTIAYQLVHTRPADLRREDADRLPFAYPEIEGLARNQEGSFSDLTPDTGANGSGPSQEGPNPAFLQLPSHPRPRPNESADQPTEPSSDLSPRQVLFLLLAELRAPDFLRHAYAFLIQQRLLEGAEPASLEQLLGEWTSELQGLTDQPLKTLNDWLKSMIPSAGPIANPLKKALQHLAKKGENALDLLRPETTETPEKTANFQHLHAAISRWADLLSGTAPGPFGGHFPEADDVELLLKKAPANRVLLANLLAGKKVIPARLRKAISGPEMQRLALLLREDLPPEAAKLLKGLQAIVLESGIYGSTAEANTRLEDYLILSSWGLASVSGDRAAGYAEKILSLIAREFRLTTGALASRLLEETSDLPSAELKQFLDRVLTENKHGKEREKPSVGEAPEARQETLNERAKTANFQHLHAAISRWADLLAGATSGPFDGHFPKADDVQLLLKKAPANRVLLANLLAGKKVILARLRKAISGPEMQRLALLLREDLPPEAAELLKGLQAIILKSGVYGSVAEAGSRMEDYLTLASWGLEAVSSDRGDAYAEKILSLIAREVGLTTIDLADRLLEENSDFPSAELQQFLDRTRAKIAPEAVKKIRQQTETKHGEAGKKTPKERRGEFYRTALLEQLKTGKTPWWEEESLAADQLFERAAKQNAKALVKLLGQNPKLAETLFPRLSTAQLEEFFVRVFPEYSGFMLAFTEALSRSGQVGSALKSKATQTAWRPAWSYVLSHQTFQTEVFVREALRTAAKDFNLKPQGLLRALSAEATARTDLHDVRYYRLAAILRELQTDLPPQQALKADQPPIAEGSANVFLGADAGAKKGPTEKQGKEGRLEDEAPATEPRAQKNTLPLEAEEKPANYADQLTEEVGLLQHFFLYGTPPAGQSSRSRSELLTLQNRIIALHPEIAGNLYRLVLGDHIARERLIRSFPEALRASILQLLLEGKMPWVERIWADLKALLPGLLSTFDSSGFRSWALREMLAFAPLVRPRPNLSDYPEHLLSGLAEQDGLRLEQFFPKLLDAVQASPTQLREDWNKLLADLQDNKSSQAAEETDEESAKKHPPMEESLFIHNSGLVILGAYLPRYFKMLDMVDNQQFRDEQAAARGVLLLEYLVSGRTEVAEHELAFNKILCGLDVPTPVPAGIVLTDEEKNVSEQMLNAIIQNWDKMNSSTVENLQGSFLIRDGLLREEEESWSLKVESKGYDVILSFLPWTISLISLPWMDKRLEVDWTTGM